MTAANTAFRWSQEYADRLIEKVKHAELQRKLQECALAEVDLEPQKLMTSEQIRAATYLLDKVLPDAPKRVEHSVGGTLADIIAASFLDDDSI